jgi:hypothetical protein
MINSINAYTSQNKYLPIKQETSKNSSNTNFGKNKMLDDFCSRIADKKQTKNIIFKIANSDIMKSIVAWGAKEKTTLNRKGEIISSNNSDKISQYLMVGYSAILQTNHIINILKNKKMPEDRKETLAINNVLTFILPTLGAFTIDKSINKGIDRFQRYAETVKNKKFNDSQAKGLKTLKTVFIFAMMYKYFANLVATPLAEVTTKGMKHAGLIGNKSKFGSKIFSR